MISFRRGEAYDYAKRECNFRSARVPARWRFTYKAPRTSDGQPDLQGYWTNATLTPVERPAALGDKLVLSEAEAKAMEGQMARRMEAANAPSDPNEVQRAGQAVGGYNMFWADFGTQRGDRQRRAPQLADRRSAAGARTDAASASQKLVSAAERRGFDGPEQRPLGERCILAFGNASGPPMLPVCTTATIRSCRRRTR